MIPFAKLKLKKLATRGSQCINGNPDLNKVIDFPDFDAFDYSDANKRFLFYNLFQNTSIFTQFISEFACLI
jgi:hypothetical protein